MYNTKFTIVTIFQCTVALSTLLLCDHHLHLSLEFLHLAKLKLCPHETPIPVPLLQPLALTLLLSLSVSLTII